MVGRLGPVLQRRCRANIASEGPAAQVARGANEARLTAKPGFFPVMPDNMLPCEKPAFFAAGTIAAWLAWLGTSRRFRSPVDPSRTGSAKNPGFWLGDSERAWRRKKPGFGKARLLPGHARQHAAMREAGLF